MRNRIGRGFTLIELLVVVAIIALLISILLPGLSQAREQAKRVKCLASVKAVATGFHTYGSEDRKELLIPIHQMLVHNTATEWGQGPWAIKSLQPAVWGGRTATVQYPYSGGAVPNATLENGPHAVWAAKTRPLNKYLYGSLTKTDQDLRLFQCPSDTGRPTSNLYDDLASPESAGIPFYDLVGNSYRVAMGGIYWTSGDNSPNYFGAFTVAPIGHKISSLRDGGRQIMAAEALVMGMTALDPVSDPEPRYAVGWHKKPLQDNVMFADGHAATVTVSKLELPDTDAMRAMNISSGSPNGNATFLRRTKTYQVDCWPAAGALIRLVEGGTPTPTGALGSLNGLALEGQYWPFPKYEDNLNGL